MHRPLIIGRIVRDEASQTVRIEAPDGSGRVLECWSMESWDAGRVPLWRYEASGGVGFEITNCTFNSTFR